MLAFLKGLVHQKIFFACGQILIRYEKLTKQPVCCDAPFGCQRNFKILPTTKLVHNFWPTQPGMVLVAVSRVFITPISSTKKITNLVVAKKLKLLQQPNATSQHTSCFVNCSYLINVYPHAKIIFWWTNPFKLPLTTKKS